MSISPRSHLFIQVINGGRARARRAERLARAHARNKEVPGSVPYLATLRRVSHIYNTHLTCAMSWSAARIAREFTPKRPPPRDSLGQKSWMSDTPSDIEAITGGTFVFVQPPVAPTLVDGSEIPYLPMHSAMPSPRARALSSIGTCHAESHISGLVSCPLCPL